MNLTTPTRRARQRDEDVFQAVLRLLASRHFPAFRNLDVEVKQGAVTVSGQVCTYYEKQVAIHSCQHVAGVLILIDQIEVVG